MSTTTKEIGKNIRNCRKKRGISLSEISKKIHKGESTVYKYETGEISIDIDTLYDIANALNIHIDQLLPANKPNAPVANAARNPTFFNDIARLFAYVFDGRSNQLIRCVFDISSPLDGEKNVKMYMNFEDFGSYKNCENTYIGSIEHYDAVTNILLTNQDSPIERASVQILAPYLDANTKWGLWNGLSSRPLMPIATKMLFSKEPLSESEALIHQLKISREDIRLAKLYNMFCVT